MRYRKLGQTDIEVSVLALGCCPIVGDAYWGPQEAQDSIATIKTAFDVGVTFFDTAEVYGNGYSEQLLAKALGQRRKEAVILSKVNENHLAAQDVREACEGSLRNLRSDYIDLYMIHRPCAEVPIAETVGALEKLRTEGKIREIGVSNFGVEDQRGFLEVAGQCAANQLAYSLLGRAIEYDIVPRCLEEGIGVLPYCPLSQGLLTGKFVTADDVPKRRAVSRLFSKERAQVLRGEDGCETETFATIAKIRRIAGNLGEPMGNVSLVWLLHQPVVTSVLAGARNPQQMAEDAEAAELELSEDTVAELTEVTEKLKELLGTNADSWQSESRIR